MSARRRYPAAAVERAYELCGRGSWEHLELVEQGQGKRFDVTPWMPDRPLPQVVLTSSAHIAWGGSMSPDEARQLAGMLVRAADVVDQARALLTEAAA